LTNAQYPFTGTGYDLGLLDWLLKYTFPTEAKYADRAFAVEAYGRAVRRHLRNGTTTACYFGTIHREGTMALVDAVAECGQRAFVGKVCMDRNAPTYEMLPPPPHTHTHAHCVFATNGGGGSEHGNICIS
jgi:guanine deaminase